jgi:hypothetical protein
VTITVVSMRELGHALHPVTITVVSPPSPVLCIAAVRVYGIADCASSPIDRIAAVRLQCVSSHLRNEELFEEKGT